MRPLRPRPFPRVNPDPVKRLQASQSATSVPHPLLHDLGSTFSPFDSRPSEASSKTSRLRSATTEVPYASQQEENMPNELSHIGGLQLQNSKSSPASGRSSPSPHPMGRGSG